jgi:abortive infection bacteriophage resistance protein
MKGNIELKEPKKFEEQLKILEDRKMIIEDKDEAIKILKSTNYYRFTAYALQFKRDNNYKNTVSFNNVYKLYKFDKRLRHLILEILESIEITVRTNMAYSLSIKYGSEALHPGIFKNKELYSGCDDIYGKSNKGLIEEIRLEIRNNSKELFVKHHLTKYEGHFPIWVTIEIFSFGMLSRTYANLNLIDQKEIAKNCFNINYQLLESWLKNLSCLRNICAHYGRLYNKVMSITPKIHTKYSKDNINLNGLYVSILAIKELTITESEWVVFRTQLKILIDEYLDVIDLNLIGFPKDWFEILSRD